MIDKNVNFLKLRRLHEHIDCEKTGTPCSLAERLEISRRTLFYMIDDLREMGAEIKYCRRKQTYYYQNDFELHIDYKITIISNGQSRIIEGETNNLFIFQRIFS